MIGWFWNQYLAQYSILMTVDPMTVMMIMTIDQKLVNSFWDSESGFTKSNWDVFVDSHPGNSEPTSLTGNYRDVYYALKIWEIKPRHRRVHFTFHIAFRG